jgi:MFS superfamily sulfate permease-like transporter
MSFTESIAAPRAFAQPGEARLVPNRELLALGMANAGGGLFGTMLKTWRDLVVCRRVTNAIATACN